MRSVIIPARAGVLCPHKMIAAELEPGDSVGGYDTYNRRVVSARIISIEKLPDAPKILVPISHFKTLTLVADTVVLTPYGERIFPQAKRQLMGYCYHNPKKLLTREVQTIIESKETVETVKLVWEGPEYIWTDGILVGTEVKGITADASIEDIRATV
jgi:hypothetical protein